MAADVVAAAAILSTGQLRRALKLTTLLPTLLPPHAARDDNTFLHIATNILADRRSEDATILFSAVASLSTNFALCGLLSGMMASFVQLWNSDDSLAERREKVAEFLYQASACLAEESTDGSSAQVIESVYRLVETPPQEFITPPKSWIGPKITPIKTNSAAHMSEETTHAIIDPKLRHELKDHLWSVDDERFFDRFFPDMGNPPPDPSCPYPSPATQDKVVEWFMDYQQQLESTSTPMRWCWKSSGDRFLYHQKTKRKVDLFVYPKELQQSPAGGSQYDWGKVVVLGELKYRKRGQEMGDDNSELVIQLANYVREAFGCQPGRRFVHSFTVVNERMRCWVFTRTGGIGSPHFRLNTKEGIGILRRVFSGYLNNQDLGLAGVQDIMVPQTIACGRLSIQLRKPFVRAPAVVTRATTCWYAFPESSNIATETSFSDSDADGGGPWILKDSWRYMTRESEGTLLKEAHDLGVQGLATYIHHTDIETVHDILGECVQPSRAVDLESKSRTKKRQSEQSSRSSKRAKLRASGASSLHPSPMSTTPASTLVSDLTDGNSQSGTPSNPPAEDREDNTVDRLNIHNRIHTRIVIARGKSLMDWDNPLELLQCMRDAIRGHRSLLTTGGILHRDISINNIMITLPQYPRPDKFLGFLIDLDLAIRVSGGTSSSPCGAPERTGTYEFLSIPLLYGKLGHYYHDDLQSFFFVLLWIAYERPRDGDLLESWGHGKPTIAADAKFSLVNDEGRFEELLEGFRVSVGREMKTVVQRFRFALWPQLQYGSASLIQRQNLDNHRDKIYEDVVAAFQWGIDRLRNEG
ncbi:hypothetical protein K440DRAFT_665378 [Wilcoxina mikolae CBS 423.85]|nr:hypothetical protein K440DRAFT_665378 [Wilcoxina mikolae CBS 423.85]